MKIYQQFLSIGKAAHFLGVTVATVRRWCSLGKLSVHHRTLGNHRRFEPSQLSTVRGDAPRMAVGYARVSSHDQKQDLVRQVERLNQLHADLVIDDLGSGLNGKTRGIHNLLQKRYEPHRLRIIQQLIERFCRQ